MAPFVMPQSYVDNIVVSLPPLVEGKGKTRKETARFASLYPDAPDTIWITSEFPDTEERGNPAFRVKGWYGGGLLPFYKQFSTDATLQRLVSGLDSAVIWETINKATGTAYLRAVGVISQDALNEALKMAVATGAVIAERTEQYKRAGMTAEMMRAVNQSRDDESMLTNGGVSQLKALPESPIVGTVPTDESTEPENDPTQAFNPADDRAGAIPVTSESLPDDDITESTELSVTTDNGEVVTALDDIPAIEPPKLQKPVTRVPA